MKLPDSQNFIDITIIEDNRYVRESWLAVLNSVPEFSVSGAFVTCEDAFRHPEFGSSDIVIMDIGLPGMSGIEGVKYITENFPGIQVIMCTVFDDDKRIFDALCNGAVGYLLKKIPAQELIHSIKMAASGGSPMTPNIARKVINSFQKPTTGKIEQQNQLTDKEKEVLEHLAHGKSYAAIGQEMFLSVDGVRYHIRHIYEKLQVHSKSQAIAKGLKDRIIQPPR